MARRSFSASFVVAALVTALLPATASGAEPPSLPTSVAAVGDSISQAVSSGGSLGSTYPGELLVHRHQHHREQPLCPPPGPRPGHQRPGVQRLGQRREDGRSRRPDAGRRRSATGLPDGPHRRQRPVHGHGRPDDVGGRLRDPVHGGDAHAERRLAEHTDPRRQHPARQPAVGALPVQLLGTIGLELSATSASRCSPTRPPRRPPTSSGEPRSRQRNVDFNAKLAEICADCTPGAASTATPSTTSCSRSRTSRATTSTRRSPARRSSLRSPGRPATGPTAGRRPTSPPTAVVHGIVHQPHLHLRCVGLHRRPRHFAVRLGVR